MGRTRQMRYQEVAQTARLARRESYATSHPTVAVTVEARVQCSGAWENCSRRAPVHDWAPLWTAAAPAEVLQGSKALAQRRNILAADHTAILTPGNASIEA